jgi:hypothetical protein
MLRVYCCWINPFVFSEETLMISTQFMGALRLKLSSGEKVETLGKTTYFTPALGPGCPVF